MQNRTALSPAAPGSNVPACPTPTPAVVLRAAAEGYRAGAIAWGRNVLIDPVTHCRCALGALAWALDPDDEDGDPRWVTGTELRGVAQQAIDGLADYIVTELDASEAVDVQETASGEEVRVRDPFETIGDWNDRQGSSAPVVAALRAAAERAA